MRAPLHSEKLEVTSLFHDPFIVVIPAADKDTDTTAALSRYLKKQPFIFFNHEYAPFYYDKLMEICQRMGFVPDITHEANNVHSILRLVENGAGASILPRTVKDHFPALNLQYLELVNIPVTTEVVLAHRPTQNTAITWFTKRYSDFFKQTSR